MGCRKNVRYYVHTPDYMKIYAKQPDGTCTLVENKLGRTPVLFISVKKAREVARAFDCAITYWQGFERMAADTDYVKSS